MNSPVPSIRRFCPFCGNKPVFEKRSISASPGGVELIAISLWDTKEQADAYNASDYPKVLRAVLTMLDGAPRVQNLNVISSMIQHDGTESGRAVSASSAAAAGGRETASTTDNKEI